MRPCRRTAHALVMVASGAAAVGWAGGCVSLSGLTPGDSAAVLDGAGAEGATVDADTSDRGSGDNQDANVADTAEADAPASCPGGVCPTVLTVAAGPERLAVDSSGVYWTSATAIGHVALDGTNAKTLNLPIAIAPPLARAVAVGPAGVPYVTVSARGAALCGADVASCGMGFVGSAGTSSSVAVDASNVYIGIFDDGTGTNRGGIYRTALDGTNVFGYSLSDQVLDVETVAGTLYYRTGSSIMALAPSAMIPVLVADLGGDKPLAFVVQGPRLVVATSSGHLRACTLTPGSSCSTSILTTVGIVSALTADGAHLFWAEGSGGSIHRCDLPTCASNTLLAEHQALPSAIAVDATSVYWTNTGDSTGMGGAVMKLPK